MRIERREPVLLRIPEAAEMLSVGRSTVYEMIADGPLETGRIGRSVRVTVSSLRTFVDNQRT